MEKRTRNNDELRDVVIELGYSKFAEGSCLFSMGNTKVLCTASVDTTVPKWKEEGSGGWITAEYAMLPRANRTRTKREVKNGKQTGRSMEIQRLIGRALRAAVDLEKLEGITITLDCDVLQADGGTRCASITGAYIALYIALEQLKEDGLIDSIPITPIAAVSVGKLEDSLLLDLDYGEDSAADVDLNLVMLENGEIVEIQGTSEGETFNDKELFEMIRLAQKGIIELIEKSKEVL